MTVQLSQAQFLVTDLFFGKNSILLKNPAFVSALPVMGVVWKMHCAAHDVWKYFRRVEDFQKKMGIEDQPIQQLFTAKSLLKFALNEIAIRTLVNCRFLPYLCYPLLVGRRVSQMFDQCEELSKSILQLKESILKGLPKDASSNGALQVKSLFLFSASSLCDTSKGLQNVAERSDEIAHALFLVLKNASLVIMRLTDICEAIVFNQAAKEDSVNLLLSSGGSQSIENVINALESLSKFITSYEKESHQVLSTLRIKPEKLLPKINQGISILKTSHSGIRVFENGVSTIGKYSVEAITFLVNGVAKELGCDPLIKDDSDDTEEQETLEVVHTS